MKSGKNMVWFILLFSGAMLSIAFVSSKTEIGDLKRENLLEWRKTGTMCLVADKQYEISMKDNKITKEEYNLLRDDYKSCTSTYKYYREAFEMGCENAAVLFGEINKDVNKSQDSLRTLRNATINGWEQMIQFYNVCVEDRGIKEL